MRYYAVIDTNVLVSALLSFRSVPGQIVREALGGAITPLYSSEILAEYEEILHRSKFPFEENEIGSVLSGIREYGVKVDASHMSFEVRDPDDALFYEVVMEKAAGYGCLPCNRQHEALPAGTVRGDAERNVGHNHGWTA